MWTLSHHETKTKYINKSRRVTCAENIGQASCHFIANCKKLQKMHTTRKVNKKYCTSLKKSSIGQQIITKYKTWMSTVHTPYQKSVTIKYQYGGCYPPPHLPIPFFLWFIYDIITHITYVVACSISYAYIGCSYIKIKYFKRFCMSYFRFLYTKCSMLECACQCIVHVHILMNDLWI